MATLLEDAKDEPLEIRITYVSPDGTVRDGDGNIVDKESPAAITVDDRI